MSNGCHTFERPEIKQATLDLITRNAEHLIGYIYANSSEEPFTSRSVRVGLVLKVLLRTDSERTIAVTRDVIEPAIADMEALLEAERDPDTEAVYRKELNFLNHCTMLDDIVTLNADMRAKAKRVA